MADFSYPTAQPSTRLMRALEEAQEPGTEPSYFACKTIYAFHPLGAVLVDAPLVRAQSMPRELSVIDTPEETELVDAFKATWTKLGRVGADLLIRNLAKLSRIYGVGSVGVGVKGDDPAKPIDLWSLKGSGIYFQLFDPLNTAGSLVIDQNPQSPDFLKPRSIRVGPQEWHPSRSFVMLHGEPVYILWSNAAFGFSGRSVFQRGLYPLRSYLECMVTDEMIARKCGLLVAKLEQPSAIADAIQQGFFRNKRQTINAGKTGNVLSVGTTESVESLDLNNIREAYEFARNNILKNIATSADSDMPAAFINQETLTSGFGEGKEDSKVVAAYIGGIRQSLQPAYDFFDNIVTHLAWTRDFYESLKDAHPDLADESYEDAFFRWRKQFRAEWPNLLVEPDSDAVEREAKAMEPVAQFATTILPVVDQATKAQIAAWYARAISGREFLTNEPLDLDEEQIAAYEPPTAQTEPTQEPRTVGELDV